MFTEPTTCCMLPGKDVASCQVVADCSEGECKTIVDVDDTVSAGLSNGFAEFVIADVAVSKLTIQQKRALKRDRQRAFKKVSFDCMPIFATRVLAKDYAFKHGANHVVGCQNPCARTCTSTQFTLAFLAHLSDDRETSFEVICGDCNSG